MSSVIPSGTAAYPASKKVSDFSSPWRTVPKEAHSPLTVEQRDEVAGRESAARKLEAEASNLGAVNQRLAETIPESTELHRKDVSELSYDQTVTEIDRMTRLVKMNVFENISIRASNGDQSTKSVSQYLEWLQLRANELDSDGTYSQFS